MAHLKWSLQSLLNRNNRRVGFQLIVQDVEKRRWGKTRVPIARPFLGNSPLRSLELLF
jgi:hypothetical protein